MAALLLVDDHPLFHEGMAYAFRSAAPDLRLVSATTASDGFAILARELSIALVLVDLLLPQHEDGIVALRRCAQLRPEVPRIAISGREDDKTIRHARAAGAAGFVGKSLSVDRILEAVRCVLDGGTWFPPWPENGTIASTPKMPTSGALTLRQLEVLTLLGLGKSNKEISRDLRITDRTVRSHLTELFQFLGVSSRTQAILAAQRVGLLQSSGSG